MLLLVSSSYTIFLVYQIVVLLILSSLQIKTVRMMSFRFVLVIVVVAFILAIAVDAAYRKPPFNGSIFGKRSNAITGKIKIYNIF